LDLSLKKTLRASEQEREDIKQQRENWQEFQANVEQNRLVFLDESGVKTNMTRLYGRASKGSRCHDKAPDGRWETVTVLSSIRLGGETESLMFDGAVDRKMFDAYIEEMLIPTLRPGDIVVMDNLSAHKSEKSRNLIESKSATCLFLPAYSPDFNPIEKMWSKVKQILRGLKARTREELFDAVAKALSMVNADDAQGWVESCGYVKSKS
jgi:transposase